MDDDNFIRECIWNIKYFRELNLRQQKFRKKILENPNIITDNKLIKCIFNPPGNSLEFFNDNYHKFNYVQIISILDSSHILSFEITKIIFEKFKIRYKPEYFYTNNLDCLKLLINYFDNEFKLEIFYILCKNLTSENFDITDFIIENYDIFSGKYIISKNYYMDNFERCGNPLVFKYILDKIPNLFNYFPDRSISCDVESANFLATINFGKKLNLKYFSKHREFLKMCRFEIYLREYIDDNDNNIRNETFIRLLEACEDYVYDYELLKIYLESGVVINLVNRFFEKEKLIGEFRIILKSLSKRYPKKFRNNIKFMRVDLRLVAI